MKEIQALLKTNDSVYIISRGPWLCASPSVDCAGVVLNCLFCRFYDLMFMLPDSCGKFVNICYGNRKQVATAVESSPSSDEDFWTDVDCGLFTSCHDANDCLELAMEVSELCYH